MGTPYILELSQGQMTYDHKADRWVLTSSDHIRIGDIDANHFKTIREFRAWGEEELRHPAEPVKTTAARTMHVQYTIGPIPQ